MTRYLLIVLSVVVCGCANVSHCRNGAIEKEGTIRLFDGESFSGWEGNLEWFRTEDRAIVGGSLQRPIPRNEFLSTRDEFRDFELRLSVRLIGEGNGGIQFRSRRVAGGNEMVGYQADISRDFWGCLYDESRRNKVLVRPDAAQLQKVLRDGWNDYRIRCKGRRIELWLNGYKTVDYVEADENIEQTGLIGLQIHGGAPSEVWYKNILLKRL